MASSDLRRFADDNEEAEWQRQIRQWEAANPGWQRLVRQPTAAPAGWWSTTPAAAVCWSSWDRDTEWAWANPHQRCGWSAATAGHGWYQSGRRRRRYIAAAPGPWWSWSSIAEVAVWEASNWEDEDWRDAHWGDSHWWSWDSPTQAAGSAADAPTQAAAMQAAAVAAEAAREVDLVARGAYLAGRTRMIFPNCEDEPYYEPYTDSE